MEPLTPEQMEAAAGLTLLFITLAVITFGLVGSWLLRFAAWWHNRRAADTDNDMSSDEGNNAARNDAVLLDSEPPANQPEPQSNAVPGGSGGGTGSIVINGVSRHMSDTELIALLAVQKAGQGERFSANAIHRLIGGRKEAVLDVVRAVRNVPEYRRSADEAAAIDQARRDLQLDT